MYKVVVMLVFSLVVFSISAPADARRRGGESQEIELVRDLPNVESLKGQNGYLDLGYLYNTWTLFFMPLFAEGGEFVLYDPANGDSYYEIDTATMEMLEAEFGPDVTGTYEFEAWRHVWGWLVLGGVVAFLAVQTMIQKRRARVEQEEMLAAINDGTPQG